MVHFMYVYFTKIKKRQYKQGKGKVQTRRRYISFFKLYIFLYPAWKHEVSRSEKDQLFAHILVLLPIPNRQQG